MAEFKVGDKLTMHEILGVPAGTKLVAPNMKDVRTRNAPGGTLFEEGLYFSLQVLGPWTIVFLPEEPDPVQELAEELWNVRNDALVYTEWEFHTTRKMDEIHEKVYRALASHVLDLLQDA